MANHVSSLKRARQTVTKTAANRANRTKFRSSLRILREAIAGGDKKFVWADARIVGDTVVVSSPAVSSPVAVRYAWANNPPCNLINKAGLPASPFRTDDWK